MIQLLRDILGKPHPEVAEVDLSRHLPAHNHVLQRADRLLRVVEGYQRTEYLRSIKRRRL